MFPHIKNNFKVTFNLLLVDDTGWECILFCFEGHGGNSLKDEEQDHPPLQETLHNSEKKLIINIGQF